ncbi:MAG: TRAP transporter substrate-binding protein [Lentisphaeraceae bacterium]|nr:TRAP transporter substrate-binding protein [Lentisphaeraceae bacterium]
MANFLKFFNCFLFLALVSTGCKKEETVKTLKLAHVLDRGLPNHLAAVRMGEKLAEYSGGKMKLQIYPGGQLGSEREYIESLQIGSLDMTIVSTGVVENFVPSIAVLSLPYLFHSKKHREAVIFGDVGDKMLSDGEDLWLKGMCFYEAGSRSFYLRDKKVMTPEDLAGLKIRVMRSYWSIKTMNALGASATPIAFGELYTALQQGVVDGAENNIPTFYQARHFEACKYYVIDDHSAPSNMVLISTHTFKGLSEQEQEWLKKAVQDSVSYQRELWKKAVDDTLAKLIEEGIEIVHPDKKAFQKQVEPLYVQLKEEKDPLYPIVEKIRNVKFEQD